MELVSFSEIGVWFWTKIYSRNGDKKINDVGKVRHNFVPYLECFSQINSKYRMETALAWRIAPNDRFMIPGPGNECYILQEQVLNPQENFLFIHIVKNKPANGNPSDNQKQISTGFAHHFCQPSHEKFANLLEVSHA